MTIALIKKDYSDTTYSKFSFDSKILKCVVLLKILFPGLRKSTELAGFSLALQRL